MRKASDLLSSAAACSRPCRRLAASATAYWFSVHSFSLPLVDNGHLACNRAKCKLFPEGMHASRALTQRIQRRAEVLSVGQRIVCAYDHIQGAFPSNGRAGQRRRCQCALELLQRGGDALAPDFSFGSRFNRNLESWIASRHVCSRGNRREPRRPMMRRTLMGGHNAGLVGFRLGRVFAGITVNALQGNTRTDPGGRC